MELKKNGQTLVNKLFSGSGWALVTVLVWELLEEALESLIALCISSVVAFVFLKALSTIAIVFATQLGKLGIKKVIALIFPFIKRLIKKEGNDKVELLKKYWTLAWNNRVTGTIPAVGFALLSFFQTFIPFATHCWWFALIVFVVIYNVAIFFGGETLTQIQERLAQVALKKEEQAIIKEAQKRIKQLAKDATKTEQTEADKAKAEAEAKANAEKEARIKKAMADLEAKAREKAEAKAKAKAKA